jgi:acetyl/propionyl-CoA carboxylase alpha subunit
MKNVIRKILVANRGEIAVRIFRTLRQMGIKSVAIYSDADAGSMHIRCAEESYRLEGDNIASTYLDIVQIISLAKRCRADAIHPGYGFLSESSEFSRAVREAGLVFIGPPDEAIRLMGNKIEARSLVQRLGLPLIKGATGTPGQLLAKTNEIGYPLLVKAAAGGGGKGMRIVASQEQAKDMLETASNEARNYFGNGEVYIEKYLDKPHHIEVQLIGDHFGNMVALFERECSIQRRYQKIIEEAPSPNVTPELREALMEAARRIGKEIGYFNAGTLEFLVTGEQFYFLEMNTRIQVEHPVTEMITGIDIVREQVSIAMGNPLSFNQQDLSIKGHAIETRVYAEDPSDNFRPSPGKIAFYKSATGAGIRVDGYLESGAEVSSMFDPMISKVISHAPTREEARMQLIKSLEEYAIHGIKTNIPFLISLLQAQEFIGGDADTHFCTTHLDEEFNASNNFLPEPELLLAAFIFATRQTETSKASVWNKLGMWRIQTRTEVFINGQSFVCNLVNSDLSQIIMGNEDSQKVFNLAKKSEHEIIIDNEGVRVRILYSPDGLGKLYLQYAGRVNEVMVSGRVAKENKKQSLSNVSTNGTYKIIAPMFGRISQIKVAPGATVYKGDTLLTLESMKMETRITAPANAQIKNIEVSAGQLVEDKQVLMVLLSI